MFSSYNHLQEITDITVIKSFDVPDTCVSLPQIKIYLNQINPQDVRQPPSTKLEIMGHFTTTL